MSNLSTELSTLENNLNTLLKDRKESINQIREIKENNEKLNELILIQAKEIEELKEKNKILRIAGGANEGDSREMKLKINEIVREVDKCIAQLNQ